MVTGHVDSWGLGALDNASGNACAVELARILAPLASDMRRSVRFVLWSGHSHGRYAGSTAWCDAHFEELERHCLLNVNSDCLGGHGATVMTESPAMASTRGLARTDAARGGWRHGLARLPFFAQLRPKLLGRRRALDLLSGLRAAAL
ncbi:MAG: M28 family metallopeptidase [Sutterella wadsworthensis]